MSPYRIPLRLGRLRFSLAPHLINLAVWGCRLLLDAVIGGCTWVLFGQPISWFGLVVFLAPAAWAHWMQVD